MFGGLRSRTLLLPTNRNRQALERMYPYSSPYYWIMYYVLIGTDIHSDDQQVKLGSGLQNVLSPKTS